VMGHDVPWRRSCLIIREGMLAYYVSQLAAKGESPKSLMHQSVECGMQAKAYVVLPSKSCAWPMLGFGLAATVQVRKCLLFAQRSHLNQMQQEELRFK